MESKFKLGEEVLWSNQVEHRWDKATIVKVLGGKPPFYHIRVQQCCPCPVHESFRNHPIFNPNEPVYCMCGRETLANVFELKEIEKQCSEPMSRNFAQYQTSSAAREKSLEPEIGPKPKESPMTSTYKLLGSLWKPFM